MAVTNWSTKASTIPESGFSVRIFFWVDVDDNPINLHDVDADPATQIQKTARIAVTGSLIPDGIVDAVRKTMTYRVAGAVVAGNEYGAQDGSNADNPAPITTGIAGDLGALKLVVTRMKKQFRLDINGDVEA